MLVENIELAYYMARAEDLLRDYELHVLDPEYNWGDGNESF